MNCALCGGPGSFDVQRDGQDRVVFSVCPECEESLQETLAAFGPHGSRWRLTPGDTEARAAVAAAEQLLEKHDRDGGSTA